VGTGAAISQFRGEQARAGILKESLLILLSRCLTPNRIVDAVTADARYAREDLPAAFGEL